MASEKRKAQQRDCQKRLRQDPIKLEKIRAQVRASNRKYQGCPEPTRPEPANCECCGTPKPCNRGRSFRLDHDHKTGIFRGWLCHKCNVGIGALGDNEAGLLLALAYIRRSASCSTAL